MKQGSKGKAAGNGAQPDPAKGGPTNMNVTVGNKQPQDSIIASQAAAEKDKGAAGKEGAKTGAEGTSGGL